MLRWLLISCRIAQVNWHSLKRKPWKNKMSLRLLYPPSESHLLLYNAFSPSEFVSMTVCRSFRGYCFPPGHELQISDLIYAPYDILTITDRTEGEGVGERLKSARYHERRAFNGSLRQDVICNNYELATCHSKRAKRMPGTFDLTKRSTLNVKRSNL